MANRPRPIETITTESDPDVEPEGGRQSEDAWALVLAWAACAPGRAGDAVVVPDGASAAFGRVANDVWLRQRPGANEPAPVLEDTGISRNQLELRASRGGLAVRQVGRRAILVRGREVHEAVLHEGDTLEIKRRALFVCVRRPRAMPALRHGAATDFPFGAPDAHGMVGESAAAWHLRDRLTFAGAARGHVLLTGESGSGKERAALAIHAMSPRAKRPLVARNAATFPPGLIDAELFGNVANYPNAGMKERPGLIGEADGSTLFLDEIGELPEELQAHLLRVLDEGGDYQRLGDARRRAVDLRLVAATNRPLEHIKADLLARLRLRVAVPGLAARPDDVPLIALHLLRRAAEDDPALGPRFFDAWGTERTAPRVDLGLLRALVEHPYTLHVRELDRVLWTAIATSEGEAVELTGDVKAELRRASPLAPSPPEVTAEAIRASLARHEGVQERVWRELGLANRYALRRLLRKHRIGPEHG